tara:strand:+ start:442 stop:2307 length:1866 start_codon:yes stop_codon:yes gene_type:complete
MAQARDIKYLNKDFSGLRQSLINYSKTYFPTTYTDFSETSPGMMFIEQVAFVGDVLSFYQDNQINETFTQYADNLENLFDLSYVMGYKPTVTGVATVVLDFYQTVPALSSGGSQYQPDYRYALLIGENIQVNSNNNGSSFIVENSTNFTVSSSFDPTTTTIYTVDGSNNPTSYLLKKSRNAISAVVNTVTIEAGSTPQEFFTTNINTANIIGILDITDSDGNTWDEVPYLAEEMVYDSIRNTNPNDPNNYLDEGLSPYLLQLKQVQRRFATRFINSGSLQIQFGAGTSLDVDAEVTPNSDNVGLGLPFEKDKLTTAYSPTNFIFTNTYGIAPTGTLSVRYLTGGGVGANVPSNTLTQISSTNNTTFVNSSPSDPSGTYQSSFNSLAVNNPIAASGGRGGDSLEEMRQNITSNFNTQYRAVTPNDYTIRALSLPSKYGKLAKIYTEKAKASSNTGTNIDMYALAFNSSGNLISSNSTLKQNIITYLSQFRTIGDSIAIKDAFVVNIGIDLEIITLPNFNSNEVLRKCILALQQYFNILNWQINEPIMMRDLNVLLDKIEGVQTVRTITISNKNTNNSGANYSQYAYDTQGATLNGVLYPSIDPMIFEVKFPNSDITGRIVNL